MGDPLDLGEKMKFLPYKEVLIETQITKVEFKRRFLAKIGKPLKWYMSMLPFKKANFFVGKIEEDIFTLKIQSTLGQREFNGWKALGSFLEGDSFVSIKMKVEPKKSTYRRVRAFPKVLFCLNLFMLIILTMVFFYEPRDTFNLLGVLGFELILFGLTLFTFFFAEKQWNSMLDKMINIYVSYINEIAGNVTIINHKSVQ